uniref:Hydroxyproline-rich glycoprotein family protein n=2 Tax=Caenorhabditis tropicalis TaxID=1561998 RepID=A0A1I7UWV2_9PELO
MNLADVNPEMVKQAPPPPPPRPAPKKPSCEPSDVAVRSPPRSRRHNQNPNYAGYVKFAKKQEKSAPALSKKAPPPPPPPVAFSPLNKGALSPALSPNLTIFLYLPSPPRYTPFSAGTILQLPQKTSEGEGKKKSDSNEDSNSLPIKNQSPVKAKSPSGSDPEGEPEVEVKKTGSSKVRCIRFLFSLCFTAFMTILLLWLLTVTTSLNYTEIDFIENKFMED